MHRDSITALSALLPAAIGAGAALAEVTYGNGTGGSVSFYGQVSPTYLGYDDGSSSYGNVVDNARSNTRAGFNLDQELGNGQTLRFNFETALGAPQSSRFSQAEEPVWSWEKTDLRKIELIWSGDFGTLSLGQGSMATDGIATRDLSRTTLVSSVTTSDTAGGYFWRLGNGDLSETTLGSVYSDFDGGRKGRIRYDTPSWEGLSFAVSYGTDVLSDYGERTYYDIAAFYGREAGDIEVSAGLGYGWVEEDGEDTGESWAGSVSVLHTPSGLNGTLATGAAKDGGSYGYGKVGWIGDIVAVGATALSADYYRGTDFRSDGSESRQWGLQASQAFDAWNIEAYLGYSEYAFEDNSGASYKESSSMLAGMRWRF